MIVKLRTVAVVACERVRVNTPPSRVLTPRQATPCARRNANNCNTGINTFQPIAAGLTPRAASSGIICNTQNGRTLEGPIADCDGGGIPQCIGQTFTKAKPEGSNCLSQTVEEEEPKRNLAGAFEMEGICPLQSPRPISSTSQPSRTAIADADNSCVTKTDQSDSSSLNATFSAGSSDPAHRSHGLERPVARTITFDLENELPNQKISPVTGRIMSYAEALSTPQRLDINNQQRVPLAALTNNSPRLQDRPVKGQQRLSVYAGNQFGGSQSMSKAKKRNLQRRGTFTKHIAPPLHHRRSKSQGVLGERPFPIQEAKLAETLHRFGLPSMSDQPAAVVGARKPAPAYMSMTASAANKRRNHTRELLSSQENQPPLNSRAPMRLHRVESFNKPAVRIPTFSKSRSAGNLNGKMNP